MLRERLHDRRRLRICNTLFDLMSPLIKLSGRFNPEVREILESTSPIVLKQGGEVAVKINEQISLPEESILMKVAESKWCKNWAEGLCRIFFDPETEEYRMCVERGKLEAAKRFLGMKSSEIELFEPDRRREILVDYICGLAQTFRIPVMKILESKPVKKYAETFGIEDFLEELKRSEEARKKWLWCLE